MLVVFIAEEVTLKVVFFIVYYLVIHGLLYYLKCLLQGIPHLPISFKVLNQWLQVVAELTELSVDRKDKIADEVNLTACNVDYLLVIEVRNRYLHSSFQISLVKELSKQEVCPVLANIPGSTWIAYVCNVKSLAEKE